MLKSGAARRCTSRSWLARRWTSRSEQGAVAIVVAISMLALLGVAGIVFDFGLARADRLTNKGYTDAAATAGVRSLDGGDGTFKPFRGACTALAYLQASDPDLAGMAGGWTYGNGAAVAGLPCDLLSSLQTATCVANNNATWAAYHGTAAITGNRQLTVDIKTGYTTPDPAFDPSGSGDNGVSAQGGCDQLAVIIQESSEPTLGKVDTTSNILTKVRTVARMTVSNLGDASAALLILERTACPAISVNSNNTFIEVKGFGDKPGVVHSDSNGSDPATCLPTNPAILGKFASPPGISARQSETGNPRVAGQVSTVAASGAAGSVPANATDGATKVCAEAAAPITSATSPPTACTAATGRTLVGRGPVDRRYNTSATTGVRAAIATASTEYNKTPTGGVPGTLAGYTVVGGSNADCKNVTNAAGYTSPTPIVFVNCSGGVNYKDFTFLNATTVVFNGDVSVNSGSTLSMPNVTRLYIQGSTAIGGGLSSSGTLNVNTGTSGTCATRTTAPSARIVVGTGAFTGGAQSSFHLCQTSVLMANEQTSAACAIPVNPVVGAGLAPYDNPCNGYVDVNAGGAMDWSAPNHVAAGAGAPDWNNLEDLALWTEASHVSSIGGGASMTLTGVFFLPNANPFVISGHGNQTIAANAQFVARKLQVQGQGTLYMRPDPNDSFDLPLTTATFSLVR
jgi:Flp pilus assembly protein TadG